MVKAIDVGRVGSWWRTAYPAGRSHEVTTFELLFDLLVAFAFSQMEQLVLVDPTVAGLLRGLLILAALWGCWVTFCLSANRALADVGTLRTTHLTAIAGMVLLGLALPQAFAAHGFTTRVGVVVSAYLAIRAASVVMLRAVEGAQARRRCVVVAVAAMGTATMLALSSVMPDKYKIPCWIAGLLFELVSVTAFTKGWRTGSALHLSARFGFIVIFSLDMSLGGLAYSMLNKPVGSHQIGLICLALVSGGVIWWLYFGTLAARFVQHTDHIAQSTDTAAHHRLIWRLCTLLHFAALAGMVMYAIGLRSVSRDLYDSTHRFGAVLGDLWAVCLAGGWAVYLLAIAWMWRTMTGRAPMAHLVGAALAIGLIPWLATQRALISIITITVIGLAVAASHTAIKRLQASRPVALEPHQHPKNWRFPWPRRDSGDRAIPLELLCDVTFVVAMAQSVRVMRQTPGPVGILQAVALIVLVYQLWMLGCCATGIASVRPMLAKISVLIQTAFYLVLAVTAPIAFAGNQGASRSTMDGRLLLAAVTTLLALVIAVHFYLTWVGEPVGLNPYCTVTHCLLTAAGPWAAWMWPGPWASLWIIGGVLAGLAVGNLTSLPSSFAERWGIGSRPRWMIYGTRPFLERFGAAYLSGCALILELLDLLACGASPTPARLMYLMFSFGATVALFWIYRPLPAPARNVMDPRSERFTPKHKINVCILGVIDGHLLIISGLGVFAAALAQEFLEVTTPTSGFFGAPLPTHTWIQAAIGLALILGGQCLQSSIVNRRLDVIRLSGIGLYPLAAWALHSAPAVFTVAAFFVTTLLLRYADRQVRIGRRTTGTQLHHASHRIKHLPAAKVLPQQRVADRRQVLTWQEFENRLQRMVATGADAAEVARMRAAYWALWQSLREAMDLDDDHVITVCEYRAYQHSMALDPDLSADLANRIRQHADAGTDIDALLDELTADEGAIVRRNVLTPSA